MTEVKLFSGQTDRGAINISQTPDRPARLGLKPNFKLKKDTKYERIGKSGGIGKG
jgi:hypothetical protein